MKENSFATNKGGVIKAPKPIADSPHSDLIKVKCGDLRDKKTKNK